MGISSINLSIAICICDVEDGRCHSDVISDLEVVPTFDGERYVITIIRTSLHFCCVTGVGAEAEAQLIAFHEGVHPVQANHPSKDLFGGTGVVCVRVAKVETTTDCGDETRLCRCPVTT